MPHTPFGPVCIYGAGGIGCAIGYALRRAGVSVTFVDSDPEKVHWGREHGVAVDRRPAIAATFEHFSEWQPDPRNEASILLCTKCYDNPAVLASLPAGAKCLPIQNGFDSRLHDRAGPIEGIASFVSECLPRRTHTRITRGGFLHLGFSGRSSPDPVGLQRLADLLRGHAPFRVAVVRDILPYKYTKLMYNAAISPLAAAAGLDNGQLLSVPRARRLFFELLRENYAILEGAGVELATIGPFHPRTVRGILRRPWLAHMLAWAFYPSLRGTYCSMSGDLPAGRSEIDHYNGHLIQLAGSRPCPLNRRAHDLVRRMLEQRRRPGLDVLCDLER
jgi:2-dehydropantoate 2-reductase